MPEALADKDDVDPGGEPERRLAVPKVVEPDPSQAGLVNQLSEAVREPVGVQRDAVEAREHQVVILIDVTDLSAEGVLAQPLR